MDLRWPAVLAVVIVGIAVVAFLALRRSRTGLHGDLPLLARSSRLTELPEYRRALRWHERMSVAALVMSIVAVTALIGATVRPTWTYDPRDAKSDTPHVDIMLCFAPLYSIQFAAKIGLVPLLTEFRNKVQDFGNQRIGMTKEYYRNFPVTADHGWVVQRMDAIIGVTNDYLTMPQSAALQLDQDAFERPSYTSARFPNPVDTLAMCAMGLPAVGSDNGRGRMIIYVGGTRLSDDPGRSFNGSATEKQIYPKELLEQTIKTAGIQVSAIVPDLNTGPTGFVEQLIRDTGGQQIRYTEVDTTGTGRPTQRHLANQRDELAGAVDKILSKPPPSALDTAQQQARQPFEWDVPDLLLQLALFASVGLAMCRVGMRLP